MSKWRLPTINELYDVYDYDNSRLKVDGFATDGYWSSTTHATLTDGAWVVYFNNGMNGFSDSTYIHYARCVRMKDGKLEWSESPKDKMSWYEAIEYCKRMNR
jgi:hypothetical protein